MINELSFSKKVRSSGHMLVIPIPKAIADGMGLKDHELVEVRIKRLETG